MIQSRPSQTEATTQTTDVPNQVNSTLTIFIQAPITGPVRNGLCPTYRLIYPNCQYSSHLAVCCHSRTSSATDQTQTLNIKRQNTFTTTIQGTEEESMTVPEDHLNLPENHTPSSLGHLDPDISEEDLFLTWKFRYI